MSINKKSIKLVNNKPKAGVLDIIKQNSDN